MDFIADHELTVGSYHNIYIYMHSENTMQILNVELENGTYLS